MRLHALLYHRHACRIDVVTSRAKGRLGETILQRHDRAGAVDYARAAAAKVVQRMGIEDIKLRGGHSTIASRCHVFPCGQVATADKDLPGARPPELGRDDSSGCRVGANKAEMPTHP